jgi:hypothetical protein
VVQRSVAPDRARAIDGVTALADTVAAVHLLYVLFVVCGLLLIWLGYAARWRWVRNWWFRALHVAAMAFVALEALVGAICPLTWLEDALRPGAESGRSFIQRAIHAVLYWELPAWVFTVAYAGFAAVVIATFIWLPPNRRSAR